MGTFLECAAKYHSADSGFTLIEVLLALVFFAVGMLSLLAFSLNLGKIQEDTARKVYCAFCAQEKMEELKFEIKTSTLHTQKGTESVERQCGPLQRSWKVSSSLEVEGLTEIEVQCNYEWNGKRKDVTLKSLIAP